MRKEIGSGRCRRWRVVVAAVATALAISLLGCHPNSIDEFREGMGDESVASPVSAHAQPLSVVESGWLVPQGRKAMSSSMHFGVEIENADVANVVNGAVLRVIGVDANGVLKFDRRVEIPVIFAGERLVLAGVAPATIEAGESDGLQTLFAIEEDAGMLRSLPRSELAGGNTIDYDNAELAFPEGLYEVSELVADQYGLDSWMFSGTVELSPDAVVNERLLGTASVSCAQLSIVFRDEAGAILCGDECIVDGLVAGEPAEFMFNCILPYGFEYASVEVHARPWTPGAVLTAE